MAKESVIEHLGHKEPAPILLAGDVAAYQRPLRERQREDQREHFS